MKKKALIFGTLGASLLLAGGVFAAYTVTDNAGKIGIKISPTEIHTDPVGTVTLSWGADHSTTFTNISNLTIGNAQTRTVKVIADAVDDKNVATTYTGKFTVELQDLSGKAPEARKLINYLHVDIKDGETKLTDVGLVARENQTSHQMETVVLTEEEQNITTNSAGKVITLEVSIDASAQPYINSINTDQVYLAVDWSRSGSEDGVKHVYIPDNGWSNMYVYSYGSSGQNADFPGVALEKDSETGYFVADLLDSHTNFIFSTKTDTVVTDRYPGDGEPGATRTALELDTAGNIYFNWNTHKFTSTPPEVEYDYYLVGEATESWSKLAVNGFVNADDDIKDGAQHQWSASVTVVAAKEYKIRPIGDGAWFGYNEIQTAEAPTVSPKSLVTEGADNNFKFNTAGTYDIFLKQYEGNVYSIWIATHG